MMGIVLWDSRSSCCFYSDATVFLYSFSTEQTGIYYYKTEFPHIDWPFKTDLNQKWEADMEYLIFKGGGEGDTRWFNLFLEKTTDE